MNTCFLENLHFRRKKLAFWSLILAIEVWTTEPAFLVLTKYDLVSKWVSNTRFTHAPVCSLCEMNHLTNRRRSDGTPLDGRHGISGLCDGSSWWCITKRYRLSWFDLTRLRTTVGVSKQENVMFSKSRKSWNGWQRIWQWDFGNDLRSQTQMKWYN